MSAKTAERRECQKPANPNTIHHTFMRAQAQAKFNGMRLKKLSQIRENRFTLGMPKINIFFAVTFNREFS